MGVLTILITGALNIACFFIGAKIGQMVSKGETIKAPNINPVHAIMEAEEKREARKEQARIDAILRNVEKYNGTSLGQEDIPR